MNPLLFALKRTLTRPLFVILLLVCVAAVVLAGTVGERAQTPPAGVYAPAEDAATGRILSHLLTSGFVLCDDREEMTRRVQTGELDCAVILPENLTRLMEQGDLEGCAQWILSPSSFVPELYQNHVAAALFREYAPYLAARSFEGTAVSREEFLAEYEAMFGEGYTFTFDVLVSEEGRPPAHVRRQSLVTGGAAIFLCALLFAFCGEVTDRSFRALLGRMGLGPALTRVVLPGAFVRAALAGCAGCLALWAVGMDHLMLPLVLYVLVLAGVGLMLAALLPGARSLYVLLALLVIASAALCPLYADPALLSPAAAAVRTLLPPYWLWLIPRHPLLWAAGAILSWAGGILLPAVRYAGVEKYRLPLR